MMNLTGTEYTSRHRSAEAERAGPRTAPMLYQRDRRVSDRFPGPTVESIQDGRQILRSQRLSEGGGGIRLGVKIKPLGDGYPSCQSDACREGRARCPTPIACQVPQDHEDVHRGPLALIVAGFLLGSWQGRLVIATVVGLLVWAGVSVISSVAP